ncbi:ABC transporter ATP-binding protein [Burkholderia mayonis]|uniref:Spermidine/putrescine import ATP-binding protein PotA n=1 Tax=Burkholderia mayonis TaxID=1385591 RepID=A0A1B4FUJ4_9BURK|nr:ABC transporter ATP-binding protein [Burkholderia mayonis]AOJ07355.1 Fe3+/spermidine/putrescine ABC transporter ATP-binding protein [Burkholderia mayonis]
MSQKDIIVSFRGVRKTYDGETLVVRHLDLDVYRGEFLTLLGPSGSGKTTCLMMLAGFEFPTGGEIWLDGVLLNRISPQKRNIGMVFQSYALFPHMTVEQNLAYPLTVRRVSVADRTRRVNDALKMVRMEGLAKRYPSQLSGGQQQRVALARALVFEPRLVLMDEPLGALDKQLRKQMQYELKSLHDKLGATFVYVTHDQDEALTMSDRVAVFDRGYIQQIDTVERLYERPDNAFVAKFIGDSNQLFGTVVSVEDGFCELRLQDDMHLHGVKVGDVRLGETATANIRPERLRLADPDCKSTRNTLVGKIRRLVYFGDHVRVHFAMTGHEDLLVKIPLGVEAQKNMIPGKYITLKFEAEHLRVFG